MISEHMTRMRTYAARQHVSVHCIDSTHHRRKRTICCMLPYMRETNSANSNIAFMRSDCKRLVGPLELLAQPHPV